MRIIDRIIKAHFPDPKRMEGKMAWYHWLNVCVRLITPIAAVVFLIQKNYYFAIVFFIATGLDGILIYINRQRYMMYRSLKDIEDQMEEPKSQWDK